jgi:hypothetical protein
VTYDLSLDISTSIIGVSVCEKDGVLRWFEYFEVPEIKEDLVDEQETAPLLLKSAMFAEWLKTRPYYGKIDKCYVEASPKGYKAGLSSAQVLMMLAKMNAIVCAAIVVSGVKPENVVDVNVTKARSAIGFKDKKTPKQAGKKKVSVKEKVREYVLTQWPNLPIKTRIVKSGPRKGDVEMEKGFADAVDAFVILVGAKKIYEGISVTV